MPDSAGIYQFNEIVVTATRRALLYKDVPRTVSVVSGRALEEQAPSTTPDALRELPGVLVQKTNLGGGSPFIRGLTGKQVLILVDGVRLNNATFRYGPNQYLNTVDPYAAERIEVVHGPGSVLYGSDALGGVVHIRTPLGVEEGDEPRDPRHRARLYQRLASAERSTATRLDVSGTAGALSYAIGGSYKHFGDLRAGNGASPVGAVDIDGVQPHTGYDEMGLSASLRYRLGARSLLKAGYLAARQDDVPKTNNLIRSRYLTEPDLINASAPQQLHLGYLAYERKIPGVLSMLRAHGSVNVQSEGRKRRMASWTATQFEEDRVRSLGIGAQATSVLVARQMLTVGFDVYHDRIASKGYEITDTAERIDRRGHFPDGTAYSNVGLYLQDEWQPANWLGLKLGTRFSRFQIRSDFGGLRVGPLGPLGVMKETYSDLTWSAEALWYLRSGLSLYTNIARGFRAPNVDDLAVDGAWDSGRDVPNPEVAPEKVVQYETGLRVDNRIFMFEAALFYNRYSDLIERTYLDDGLDGEPGTSDDLFQFDNVAKAVIRGAETRGRWYVAHTGHGSFSVSGNASYIRGQNVTAEQPIRRIPPAMALVGIRWDSGKAWGELFARGASRQSRLSAGDIRDERIPDGGTPAWMTVNARGGYVFSDNVRFHLGLENVTNERYRIHGSGIDEPGFNIVMGAAISF